MLIDETAGSGGDLLPWMFRKFSLGPLVGKRTWGGLVGILGFPVLMDGGTVMAPNLAIWTEDGFIVENEGVAPDVEVEQTPKDVIAGKDPQLEKAIEMVLAELAKAPPVTPSAPPPPRVETSQAVPAHAAERRHAGAFGVVWRWLFRFRSCPPPRTGEGASRSCAHGPFDGILWKSPGVKTTGPSSDVDPARPRSTCE
jgi:hypothetical protein